MDEKRNDKRQKRVIILLLLLIFLLLVFILILLLRKPTVIIQDNQPKTNNTQEVKTDDKSKSSDQTIDDKDKEEDKEKEKIFVTPKQEEEPQPTPGPTPGPTPSKKDGIIETKPVGKGDPKPEYLSWTGESQLLVTEGESSTGEIVFAVTEYDPDVYQPKTYGSYASTVSKSDAGVYYVWYYSKAKSGYKDTKPEYIKITIDGNPITLYSPSDGMLPYNGENQTLGVEVIINSGEGVVKYALGDSKTSAPKKGENVYKTTRPTAKDVGMYYVWYYVEGSGQYNDTVPACMTTTITEGESSYTAPTAIANLKEKDTAQALINAGTTTSTGCKFYYGLGADVKTEPTSYDTTVPTRTTAGTYYVWWYLDGGTNYRSTDPACITVIIKPKANPATCVAPTAKTGLTFNKALQVVIEPGSAYDSDKGEQTGTIRYKITNADVTETPQPSETNYPYTGDNNELITNASLPSIKNAGEYKIWYYVKGNGDYADTTPDFITVSISKMKGVIYTDPEYYTLYANSQEQELLDATTASGSPNIFEYSIDDKQTWSTSVPKKSEVGTYRVYYRTQANINYSASDENYIDAEIQKPYASLIVAPKPIPGVGYNGTPAIISTPGEVEGGTIYYRFVEDTGYAVLDMGPFTKNEIPPVTEAKNYRLEYYIVGDDDHQNVGSKNRPEFIQGFKLYSTVAKLNPSPQTIDNLAEDGQEHNLVTAGISSSGIMKYALTTEKVEDPTTIEDSKFTTKIPTATDQGKYYVYYYGAECGDYGRSEIGECEVTIDYPRATFTKFPQVNSGLTYKKGESKEIAKAGTANSKILYAITRNSIQPDKSAVGWSETIPTNIFGTDNDVVDAGTYYLWAYVKAYTDQGTNKQYSDSEMACITGTIGKANSQFKDAPVLQEDSYYEFDGEEKILFKNNPTTDDGDILYYVSTISLEDINTDFSKYRNLFKETVDKKIYPNNIPNQASPYYVYYYIKGDSNHMDSPVEIKQVTITGQDDYYITQPTGITATFDSYDAITVTNILPFDNKGSLKEGTNCKLKYAVTTKNEQPNLSDFDYYDNVEFDRTEPGTYYIWFYIAEDSDGYTKANKSGVSCTISTINVKASYLSYVTLINQLDGNNLPYVLYEGGAFSPFNPAVSDNGTAYYALTAYNSPKPDDSLFTDTLPSISEIGEYSLHYFLKGENGYLDNKTYQKFDFEVHRRAVIDVHPTLKDTPSLDNGPVNPINIVGSSADGDVLYCVRYENDAEPTSSNVNDSFYKSDDQKLNIDKPESYYVYYAVKSSIKFVDPSVIYKLPITVTKKTGGYKNPAKLNENVKIVPKVATYLLEKFAEGCTGAASYAYTLLKDYEPSINEYYYPEYYTDPLDAVQVYAPGTYYVWFRIDESDEYEAVDPVYLGEVVVTEDGTPTLTPPVPAEDLVYTGLPQSVLKEGGEATTDKGEIYYYLAPERIGWDRDLFTKEVPTATYPGLYTLYYCSYGSSFDQQSYIYQIPIYVEKAEIESEIVPQGIVIEYDKEEHQLVNLPMWMISYYELEYVIGPSDGSKPTDNDNWVSIDYMTASKPGQYYIWYRVKENEIYKASEPSCVISLIRDEARIEKDPTVLQEEFTYKGYSFDPLKVHGSSTHGTVMYYVTTNGSYTPDINVDTFTETVSVKDANENNYYIWYYCKSNDPLYCDGELSSNPLKFKINKIEVEFLNSPIIANAISTDGNQIKIHKASSYSLTPAKTNCPRSKVNVVYGIISESECAGQKAEDVITTYYEYYDPALFNAITSPGNYYLVCKAMPVEGEESNYSDQFKVIELIVEKERNVFAIEPEGVNETYTGSPITLISNTPVSQDAGTIYYAIGQDDVNAPDPYINDSINVLYSTTIPTATYPGTYYVWCFADKTANYDVSKPFVVTSTITGDAPYIIPTVTAKDLKYTGSDHVLVDVDDTDATDGTMYYHFEDYPTSSLINDKTQITETDLNNVKQGKLGQYIVYYYYAITGGPETDISYVIVNIGKGDCSLTEQNYPRSAGFIEFDGSLHNLVLTPLVPNADYEIRYYVTDVDEEIESREQLIDTSIPQYSNTGTYRVWWYGKCTSGNYKDSSPLYFDVTIGNKAPGYIGAKEDPEDFTGKVVPKNNGYLCASGYEQIVLDTNKSQGNPYANGSQSVPVYYYVTDVDDTNIDKSMFTTELPRVKDPGIYAVYYYGAEGKANRETSIKSFTVSVEDYIGYMYQPNGMRDTYQPNLTRSLLNDPGKPDDRTQDDMKKQNINIHIAYALGTETTHPDDSMFTPDVPKASDAGIYYIYSFIASDAGYRMSDYYMTESIIDKQYLNDKELPDEAIIHSFIEDGDYHEIIDYDVLSQLKSDLTAKLGIKDPTIMYYLASEDEIEQFAWESDGKLYVDQSIPKYLFTPFIPEVSGVGRYVLFYYLKGDNNYYDSNVLCANNIEVASETDILPKAAKGLVYNGTEHQLITAGESNTGRFVYALASGFGKPLDSDYSDELPTAINAAGGMLGGITAPEEYQVYYKKIYDDGSSSVPSICYVSIEQKISTFEQKAKAYDEIIYTGEPQSVIEIPAVGKSQADGDIYYAVYDHEPDLTKMVTATGKNIPTEDGEDFLENIMEYGSELPLVTEPGTHYIAYAVVPPYVIDLFISLQTGIQPSFDPEATNYTCLNVSIASKTDAFIGFDVNSFDVIEINVTKQSMEVDAPTTVSTNYTGEAISLVNAGSADHGDIYYALTYEDKEPSEELFSTTIPTAINPGTYYIWWFAKSSDPMYESTEVACITSTIIGGKDDPNIIRPVGKDELSYSGDYQDLLSNLATSTSGIPKYLVTKESPISGAPDPKTIPYTENMPQGKDAGTYYVWYYSDGDKPTVPEYITVTISKGTIVPTKAPTLKSDDELRFYENPVAVLNPGETDNGTFMYALQEYKKGMSEDAKPELSDYSSDPSVYTISNANARYNVFYYIKGDDNYNDIDPVKLGMVQLNYFDPRNEIHLSVGPQQKKDLYTTGGSVVLTNEGQPSYGYEYWFYVHKMEETDIVNEILNKVKFDDFKPYEEAYVNVTTPGKYLVVFGLYNNMTQTVSQLEYFNNGNKGIENCYLEGIEVFMGKAEWKVKPEANTDITVTSAIDEVNLIKEGTGIPLNSNLKVTYLVYDGIYEGKYPAVSDIKNSDCKVTGKTGWFTVFAVINTDKTTVDNSEIERFTVYIEPLNNEITTAPVLDVGDPTNVAYTGNPIKLVKELGSSLASDDSKEDIYYKVSRFSTPPIKGTEAADGWAYGEILSQITVKDVGTYYLWYYSVGNNLYGQTDLVPVEITVKGDGPSITVCEPNDDIVYDEVAYNLFGNDHSIFKEQFKASKGNVLYCLTQSNQKPSTENFKQYTNQTTFDKDMNLQIINAGSYYLWFYADDGGGNTTDIDFIKFNVEKGDYLSILEPKIYDDLYFDGQLLQIAKAGAVYGGVMKYRVSESNSKPASSEFKALADDQNALCVKKTGNYYLWYCVTGDNNHNEVAPTFVGEFEVNNKIPEDVKPKGAISYISGISESLISTGGKFSNGTIHYLFSKEKENYHYTDISQVLEISKWGKLDRTDWENMRANFDQVETYYIWYYIEYDDGTISNLDYVNAYCVESKEDVPVTQNRPRANSDENGIVYWDGNQAITLIGTLGTASDGSQMYYAVTTNKSEPADDSFKTTKDANDSIFMVNESGTYYLWYAPVNKDGIFGTKEYKELKVINKNMNPDHYVSLPYGNTVVVYNDGGNYDLLKDNGETKPGYTLFYYAAKGKVDNPPIDQYTIFPPTVDATNDPAGEWSVYYFVSREGERKNLETPSVITVNVTVAEQFD